MMGFRHHDLGEAPAPGSSEDTLRARAGLIADLGRVRERAVALESFVDVVESREALASVTRELKAAQEGLEAANREVVTKAYEHKLDDDDEDDEGPPIGFLFLGGEEEDALMLERLSADVGDLGELAYLLSGSAPDEKVLEACTWDSASRLGPYCAGLKQSIQRRTGDLNKVRSALDRRQRQLSELEEMAVMNEDDRCDEILKARPKSGRPPRMPKTAWKKKHEGSISLTSSRPASSRSLRSARSPRVASILTGTNQHTSAPLRTNAGYYIPITSPRARATALRKIELAASDFNPARDALTLKAFEGYPMCAEAFRYQWAKAFQRHVLTLPEAQAALPLFDLDGDGTIKGDDFIVFFRKKCYQVRYEGMAHRAAETHVLTAKHEKEDFERTARFVGRVDVESSFEREEPTQEDLDKVEEGLGRAALAYADGGFRSVGHVGLGGFRTAQMEPWELKQQCKQAFNIALSPRELGAVVAELNKEEKLATTVSGTEFLRYFFKIGDHAKNQRKTEDRQRLAKAEKNRELEELESRRKRCDIFDPPGKQVEDIRGYNPENYLPPGVHARFYNS